MTEQVFDTNEVKAIGELEQALKSLAVAATVEGCAIKGPMRRYSVRLAPKTRPSRLEGLAEDLALLMRSNSLPLVRPSYQDGLILIEFMYNDHPVVNLDEILKVEDITAESYLAKNELPIVFGVVDIDKPLVVDLSKLPHLLVAGATGSGKSVFLHSIIYSLLLNSKSVNIKLAIIDPKFVEFSKYSNSSSLMYPVVNDTDLSIQMIDQLIDEVERRLRVFQKYNCRDAEEYRKKVKKIPYIVLIIDELADLIKSDKKVVEHKLCILVQKCRAAGIFVVAATQHPSSKVITGDIKANFPAKVAFKVSTQTHSRVILDRNGAERLLGNGDGLFLDESGAMKRFKGALPSKSKTDVSSTPLKKKEAKVSSPPASSFLSNVIKALNASKKGR